ncbi:MAG: hypothetical protein QME52_04320 [Bacteroidota bacterium]|nr:hypothetical protein [Bacteroidota bacterium]
MNWLYRQIYDGEKIEAKNYEDAVRIYNECIWNLNRLIKNGKYKRIAKQNVNYVVPELPKNGRDLLDKIFDNDPNFPQGLSFRDVWCVSEEDMLERIPKILRLRARKITEGKPPPTQKEYYDYVHSNLKNLQEWKKENIELDEFKKVYIERMLIPNFERILEEVRNKKWRTENNEIQTKGIIEKTKQHEIDYKVVEKYKNKRRGELTKGVFELAANELHKTFSAVKSNYYYHLDYLKRKKAKQRTPPIN